MSLILCGSLICPSKHSGRSWKPQSRILRLSRLCIKPQISRHVARRPSRGARDSGDRPAISFRSFPIPYLSTLSILATPDTKLPIIHACSRWCECQVMHVIPASTLIVPRQVLRDCLSPTIAVEIGTSVLLVFFFATLLAIEKTIGGVQSTLELQRREIRLQSARRHMQSSW